MKANAIKQLKASALGMNQFILEQARQSSLPFKHYYALEAPINTNIFKYSEEYRADKSLQPQVLIGAFNTSDSRKGFSMLVEALKLLAKKLTPEHLRLSIMVLQDTDISNLKADCYKFIEFEFAKTPENLARLYHQADLFVNTSIDDSGPLMMSEAIFCGVPFVATNVGITSELVSFDANLGCSVPVLDAEKLADTLYNVLFSSVENKLVPSNERAISARKYYSQFYSLEKLMKELLEH
jgi:glycosyltransferase involved in cell wall biosynthesis